MRISFIEGLFMSEIILVNPLKDKFLFSIKDKRNEVARTMRAIRAPTQFCGGILQIQYYRNRLSVPFPETASPALFTLTNIPSLLLSISSSKIAFLSVTLRFRESIYEVL